MSISPNGAIKGLRVRVVGAPERTGTIVGDEPRDQDGVLYVKVLFDTGTRGTLRLTHLEAIPTSRDLIGDILRGQLEGPESLRRNLLHEKLNGRLTEVMYSMDASDTTFYAYQFKPVVKLLESPTNSLLVADEVGLGKTIEAGLIWTELRAREGAQTLLVVCPPHLVTKWKNELKRRFGVDAKDAGPRELLEALDEARRGTSRGFALVGSYHGLRPPKESETNGNEAARRLAERLDEWCEQEEPFLDLLVMDEAAIMRNAESQTSKLGGLLAPICKHKVYLSATPLHTHSRNLFTLLKRLDPDTFPDEHSFNAILEANAPLVRLRRMILAGTANQEELMAQIAEAGVSPLLEESKTLADLRQRIKECELFEDPKLRADLAYRSERTNLLSYVVTRTRKREVDLNRVVREVNTVLVPLEPEGHEERLYNAVTEAVWDYAEDRGIGAGFLTVMPQRQVTSCMAAACECLVSGFEEDQELNPDIGSTRGRGETRPLVTHLKERLNGLFDPAEFAADDSKYKQLVRALNDYWQQHPDSKVVLFAYFKPTLRYLAKRLAADNIPSLTLTGDVAGDKQAIVDEFAKPSSAKILLSSEVGSEGLDLQFASVVVNYDLPWNPMVVEQRIGRIDRIGQPAERIVVINLICQGTVDERIYHRLYERLDLFQRTLGDLEAVIGPLLTSLNREILSNRLTTEQQIQKIEATRVAMENKMKQEEELEKSASILAAYGDYVVNQIAAAHDRKDWVTGEDLEVYIRMFFQRSFPATRIHGIDQAKRIFEIELDSSAVHEFDRFLSERNLRGQTRLTGMEPRKVRFDHRMFTPSERGIEVVHQAHPLVRFAGNHLRVNRVIQPVPIAVEVPHHCRPSEVKPGLYAFVSQRWTIEGLRNYEKIHHEVRVLADGSSVKEPQIAANIVEVAAALGQSSEHMPAPGDELLEMLGPFVEQLEFEADGLFHQFEERCRLENEDRRQIQIRGVDRFEKRSVETLNRTLAQHRAMGRDALVAATEGRIRKLQSKCEIMRGKITAKSNTLGDCVTIAAGFVLFH